MNNTIKTNLEFLKNRRFLIGVLFGFLILSFIPELLIYLNREPEPSIPGLLNHFRLESKLSFGAEISAGLRMLVLIFISGGLAICRGVLLNPLVNDQHQQWLALLPWSVGSPLPAGAVHITLPDYILLFFMTLIANLTFSFFTYLPVFVFSVFYLLPLCYSLYDKQRAVFTIVLFLLPAIYYCHENLLHVVAVLFLIYLLLYMGLYLAFKNFPWGSKYWDSEPISEYKQNAVLEKTIVLQHRLLNVFEPLISISVYKAFIISALVVWWFQPFLTASTKPAILLLVPFIALYIAFARVAVYTRFLRAPINFFGRIFTGRWIIPGYDYVFIAPIIVFAIAVGLPKFFMDIGLNYIWNFNISLFFTVFLTFALPPSLKNWRLTGQHRFKEPVIWNRKIGERADPTAIFFTRMLIKLFR